MDGAADAWSDRELSGCTLADERLVTRLRKLLVQMGSAMEQKFPWSAKIGPIPRQPTASSRMCGPAKRTF
jgi:hypothetical protein